MLITQQYLKDMKCWKSNYLKWRAVVWQIDDKIEGINLGRAKLL